MNIIRPDFPKDMKVFFNNLINYLDTDLFFYGSVNRPDYVHNQSDIDVAVFTDNEYSMMAKLQHYLQVTREAFDKVVWKLDGQIIYGYKIKCDKHLNSKCEIVVYNNDFKEVLLPEMRRCNTIPFFINCILAILKTLHYTLHLLPKKQYSDCKRFLFNHVMADKQDSIFYLIKQVKDIAT